MVQFRNFSVMSGYQNSSFQGIIFSIFVQHFKNWVSVLKYKRHTEKYTDHNCTAQWILRHIKICNHYHNWIFPSLQKEPPLLCLYTYTVSLNLTPGNHWSHTPTILSSRTSHTWNHAVVNLWDWLQHDVFKMLHSIHLLDTWCSSHLGPLRLELI